MGGTVFEVVAAHAATDPDAPALSAGARRWTYGDLVDDVERVGGGLLELGLAPRDRVAVVAGNRPEVALTWLAGARTGLVPVLLNSLLSPDELVALVRRLAPTALVIDRQRLADYGDALAPLVPTIVGLDDDATITFDELRSASPTRAPLPGADDEFEITVTSGTTSQPKLVSFSHGTEVTHWTAVAAALGLGEHDRVRVVTPLFHSSGIRNATFTSWCAGGAVDVAERFSASRFWADATAVGATWSCLVETIVAMLLRQPATEADRQHTLRFVMGGARRDALEQFEERFGVGVTSAYGMTECGCPVVLPSTTRGPELAAARRHRDDVTLAGRVVPGCDVQVVTTGADGETNEAAADVLGEILVESSLQMRGYVDTPVPTATGSEGPWLRTGDLGLVSPDGYLYFAGRLRDVIRRGGENLAAAEVEGVLDAHPSVVRSAVVGVPDDLYGEAVKAVIVPDDPDDFDAAAADDLWEWCAASLAGFKVPRFVEVRAELPVNASGRVRKHELVAAGAGRVFNATRRPRRGDGCGDAGLMAVDWFPVERGHIHRFAQAIGDPNPIYVDDDHTRRLGLPGVIAPPTFSEAGQLFDPEFPYRPAIGRPWFGSAAAATSGPPPTDTSGTAFHAETHLEFVGLLRPGQTLHTVAQPGRTWERTGRRGGHLTFADHVVDFVDERTEVLVRCRTVGVTTEHVVESVPGDGDGDGDSEPCDRTAPPTDEAEWRPVEQGVAVGDERTAVVVDNLPRARILMYAGVSGDFSPQHTDEVYAREVGGYPTVFAHGMLTMAMATRVVTDWFGPHRIRTLGTRFLAQVWPGATVTAQARVTGIDAAAGCADLTVTTYDQHGAPVTTGYATVELP